MIISLLASCKKDPEPTVLTVSDVLGRVIKQAQVADYEDISTENIQSGLYQVTVRKQGEQAVFQTGKMVIKE